MFPVVGVTCVPILSSKDRNSELELCNTVGEYV